mgnify:CR=1 FL=1
MSDSGGHNTVRRIVLWPVEERRTEPKTIAGKRFWSTFSPHWTVISYHRLSLCEGTLRHGSVMAGKQREANRPLQIAVLQFA